MHLYTLSEFMRLLINILSDTALVDINQKYMQQNLKICRQQLMLDRDKGSVSIKFTYMITSSSSSTSGSEF